MKWLWLLGACGVLLEKISCMPHVRSSTTWTNEKKIKRKHFASTATTFLLLIVERLRVAGIERLRRSIRMQRVFEKFRAFPFCGRVMVVELSRTDSNRLLFG